MAMRSSVEAGNGSYTVTTMNGPPRTYVTQAWQRTFTVAPSPAHNTANKPPFPNFYAYTKTWTRECKGFMRTDFKNHYMPEKGIVDWVETRGVFRGNLRTGNNPPDFTDVYSNAVAKLYDSIKSSEINVGASLVEGRETLEMIKKLLPEMPDKQTRKTFGLLSAISAKAHRTATLLFRLQRQLRKQTTKTLGSSWLGWSLGVAPLLADIENLRSHLLTDGVEGPLLFAKARASGNATTGGQPSPTDEGCTVNSWYSVREELGVFYRIHNLHTFENWRAGLSVRPSQIWEGITLSFLIDYFVKVGELLETFENAFLDNGITFVAGYRTTTSQTVHTTIWYRKTSDSYGDSLWSFSGDSGVTTKSRSPLSGFPCFVKPRMQIPRSSQKLSIIGALLTQLKR